MASFTGKLLMTITPRWNNIVKMSTCKEEHDGWHWQKEHVKIPDRELSES
jgi:hypothetical protein